MLSKQLDEWFLYMQFIIIVTQKTNILYLNLNPQKLHLCGFKLDASKWTQLTTN